MQQVEKFCFAFDPQGKATKVYDETHWDGGKWVPPASFDKLISEYWPGECKAGPMAVTSVLGVLARHHNGDICSAVRAGTCGDNSICSQQCGHSMAEPGLPAPPPKVEPPPLASPTPEEPCDDTKTVDVPPAPKQEIKKMIKGILNNPPAQQQHGVQQQGVQPPPPLGEHNKPDGKPDGKPEGKGGGEGKGYFPAPGQHQGGVPPFDGPQMTPPPHPSEQQLREMLSQAGVQPPSVQQLRVMMDGLSEAQLKEMPEEPQLKGASDVMPREAVGAGKLPSMRPGTEIKGLINSMDKGAGAPSEFKAPELNELPQQGEASIKELTKSMQANRGSVEPNRHRA
jgi:hypothetical protein